MADLKFLVEEWPAISRRLDEGLSLAPAQRDAWLAALVETDSIKEKLHQLLFDAAGVETGDFLEALPNLTIGRHEEETGNATSSATAGAVIGPYRLIRELGVGGMGSVWLSERIDGGLKRQVALKLPRLSWSRGLAERMRRERDILASLDHPNIARIYDAGLDEHGRPYLALEYVEGAPIDIHCRNRALPVRERLGLLLQVARAVSHAHARLVVHRDLKPANILVTGDGQVRLLDFGIAKLLEGELTRETKLTRQSGRALTLDYASPEQIRGEAIGTASDVYSLGVVAYELLTEAKPYQLARQSAAALEEAIASVDVRLASTAATSPGAVRALIGDLDAILNKSLKKNVSERYPTVDEFARDIERHLANLPVAAQPDALGYRVRKFLRRNKLPIAAATAVGASLIAGLSVAIWQASVASRERDQALNNADRAELANGFLVSVIGNGGSMDSPVIMRDLLAQSEKLAESGLSKDPAQQATLFRGLATIYTSLGQPAKAHELLQRARQSASQSQDRPLQGVINCQAAFISTLVMKSATAKQEITQALEFLRDDAAETAVCLKYLAFIAENEDDAPAAVLYSERALAALQKARRPQFVLERGLRASLARGHYLIGAIAQADREFESVMREFDAADLSNSPEGVTARNNWAILRNGSGDAKRALELYDQLIVDSAAHSPDGKAPVYVYANRARALALLGNYEAAIAAYSFTLDLAVQLKQSQHVLYATVGLADSSVARGKIEEAEKWLKQASLMLGDRAGQKHPAAIGLLISESDLAMSRGEFADAHARLTTVIDLLNDGRKPSSSVSIALRKRSQVLLARDQTADAAKDAEASTRIARDLRGANPHSYLIGNSLLAQACVAAANGNAPRTHTLAEEALGHLTQAVLDVHPGRRVASDLFDGKIAACPARW